jgi:hypothetical protein
MQIADSTLHIEFKLLKNKVFEFQKSLDTPLARLIRFRQYKFLTEESSVWNYSPLKKRPPELPGGLFVSALTSSLRKNGAARQ